ncbi:MAG TPA: DNA polymerase III subunit delta' [Bacillota bacterium]|nr:DNA polymerase III subunit delta' [Bacillota bacterium]HPZ91293.1 DNA polymerase III subunit delta' [Bacillota bacterium]HQE02456.1 DNA polymerase III subunit delta' [Bacillota bacterium]
MSNPFPGFWGNERVARILFRALQGGTLAHTLLFTGPAGCGKKTLARKVAERLFCPDLCGKCRNCALLKRGSHPDFLMLGPEANFVRLEQARRLQSFLTVPANSAPYKVAVLEDAHRLTPEAGNSLLKILEEPRERTVCILTADNVDNVLPTLVSRSQVYNLAPLPPDELKEILVAKGAQQAQAEFLAAFSGGIPGKALALLADSAFSQQRENFARDISAVLARRRDPLEVAEAWHSQPQLFLDLLDLWLRDMLMLQTRQDYRPANIERADSLAECNAVCPVDKVLFLLEESVLARERLQALCNSRLVFDSLLLKMWEV